MTIALSIRKLGTLSLVSEGDIEDQRAFGVPQGPGCPLPAGALASPGRRSPQPHAAARIPASLRATKLLRAKVRGRRVEASHAHPAGGRRTAPNRPRTTATAPRLCPRHARVPSQTALSD
jgi:hypothetical protein